MITTALAHRPALAAFVAAACVVLWMVVLATTRREIAPIRAVGRGRRADASDPRTSVPAVVGRALAAAGVPASQHATLHRCWLGGVALALVAAPVVPAAPVIAAVVAACPPALVVAGRGRAARLRQRDLPGALDTLVAAVRAGHSLSGALQHAGATTGPVRAELGTLGRSTAAGTPLHEAVAGWAARHHDPGTQLAAAALAVAADAGGSAADALEAAATSVRDRAAVDDEILALSVQARASAALLTLTPVGFMVLLSTLDPASAHFLLGTPVGWACLIVGVALDAVGALWMRHLVARAR